MIEKIYLGFFPLLVVASALGFFSTVGSSRPVKAVMTLSDTFKKLETINEIKFTALQVHGRLTNISDAGNAGGFDDSYAEAQLRAKMFTDKPTELKELFALTEPEQADAASAGFYSLKRITALADIEKEQAGADFFWGSFTYVNADKQI